MKRVFVGFHDADAKKVVLEYGPDGPIDLGLYHGPAAIPGFWSWGYPSPGTTRLAIALLSAVLGSRPTDPELIGAFAQYALMYFATNHWVLPEEVVENFVRRWNRDWLTAKQEGHDACANP